jgi:histone-lysine N-methyltransferase SETMAR
MNLEMDLDKENIHTLLHNHFKNGVKAAEAARLINAGIGADVVSPRVAQKWFKKFRAGRNSTKRKQGSGRPPTVDKRVLANRLQQDPAASSAELARGHCSTPTAWRWLRKSGRRPRRTKWIPHELTDAQKHRRETTCLSNIARYRRGHLLNRLVTCDESYINYDGTMQKVVWRKPGEDPISTS